jgi:hypothetical protein
MSTIVNTPNGPTNDSSAGWAVAVIILLVVVAGGIFWYAKYRGAPANPGATIQVNLPTGGDNSGGGTGGPAPTPTPTPAPTQTQ